MSQIIWLGYGQSPTLVNGAMVGNHRTITQTATDDLSRGYGGVYSVFPDGTHPHQATTIFSPATSVTASTGFVPSLASPSKGEPPSLISSNGNGVTPTYSSGTITTPGGSVVNTVAWQLRDTGSKSTTASSGSGILEEKRKRKCWEVESGVSTVNQGAGPKVAIATPTIKKVTVPVALTSPTSRRVLSPVAGQDLEQVISSSKRQQDTSMSTTSSLRAIRPCKTSEPNTTSLPITSTTTSGIPVGIAVARQRCTSASQHVTVTNTATTSYPDLNGMTGTGGPQGNGLATSQQQSMSSMTTAATSHGLMTGTGHGMQTATMGNGQCLPAMTLLTCDDGNNSNGWAASPWHYPIPQLESQLPQLSQPSNLQLVRDPATGQFLLLPTASFDSMPRTVMWPAPAQGHPGSHQLILPQAGPPPLILDNRLVALTTPAPPQQQHQDKNKRGGQPVQHHQQQQQQATLVKLEDTGSITGVMMPPTDYSKATLGSDNNSGYAVIHHPSSFINPNYSAISSSTGSFFIQHISRNNTNGPATMTMSPAPTLFNANTGPRTNNLLISAQQLPNVGTQQLTLAPSTGDLKTFCYSDNLYHNTTTTTMYNLQQTTSVVNQQTSGALSTSTQQLSTTSILVNNDKLQNTGTNATLCTVESEPTITTGSYGNNQQCAVETEPTITTTSYGNNQQQVEYNQCNTSESSSNQLAENEHSNQLDNENSNEMVIEINEDSQTSVRGNEEDEVEEDEEENDVRMKNDAGNQTDMPEEVKEGEKVDDDDDDATRKSRNNETGNSQHDIVNNVQNDISDMPMSLNYGNNNDSKETLRESEESESKVVKQTSSDTNQTPSILEQRFETESKVVRQKLSHANQTQDIVCSKQTPSIIDTEQRFETETSEQIICDKTEKVSKDTLINLRKQDSHTKLSVDSISKDNISPESKKKLKQMPPLYPIHFLPVKNPDPNNKDQRLVGFRSMPLLEDEHRVKTGPSNNKKEDLTINSQCEETRLAVNALIGLSDKRNEFEDKNSTICDNTNLPQHEVKTIPRILSVSNLLDKNFSTKYNRNLLQQKDVKRETISGQSNLPDAKKSGSETAVTSVEKQDSASSSDGCTDEILEVANILCSGLFTSSGGGGKSHQNISSTDVNKACDTVQTTDEDSRRKLSESSAESGVDLSGLELLSISIEHLEKKDHACDQEEMGCHKEVDFSQEAKAQQDFHEDSCKDESSLNDSGISRGLDLLCALAHERFLEEKSPSPHPSSSFVRDSSPLVRESSMSPALLKAWNSHQRQTSSPSPSKWMLSSDTDDEMFVQPYKPRPYKRPAGVPYKEVSHTYRSAKSEQETRRVLASKQTYHYVPPTSIDLKEMETRKLLAEIQREFREAQKELSRLTPKKSPVEKTPLTASSGHDLSGTPWKSGGTSEANLVTGNGNVTPTTMGVKRKPGRPRKTEKESVESLKHSGKKVRDMINDTPPSPKDNPRPKLCLTMSPATPSETPALQAKFQQSPPVLTPFSPLDQGGDCTPLRPPTLHVGGSSTPGGVGRAPPTLVAHSVKKQQQQQHGGGNYYKRQLTMDEDSEDSDGPEPPELSPESQQQVAQSSSGCRKRGRPPKKHPEPRPTTPEHVKPAKPTPTTPEPVKKPVKPTFVSIILANKNKQAGKPAWEDDVKPNKIRPKLKAEAKVKTLHNAASDSEDEYISDLEDTPSLSITVRKPSLVASSTHVKKIKPVGAAGKPATVPGIHNGEKKLAVDGNSGETSGMFRKSGSQDLAGEEKSTSKSSGGDVWGRKKVLGVDGCDKHDKNGYDKYDRQDKNVLGKKSHSLDAPDRHGLGGKKSLSQEISDRHIPNDKHVLGKKTLSQDFPDKHGLTKKSHSQDHSSTVSSATIHPHHGKKSPDLGAPAGKKHKRTSGSAEIEETSTHVHVEKSCPKRAKRTESSSSSVSQSGHSVVVPCDSEQRECRLSVEYLIQCDERLCTRVLVLNQGLLYAGQLTAISPPDIYGVQLDGERAHRPNIYTREEVLNDVILEVKLTLSSVTPGKRMCAYWSQQYRCLYPGVVVSEPTTSPSCSGGGGPTFVNVEFDDGDSGSINVEDIRALPQDFPLMTYSENPLLTLGAAMGGGRSRKRRNSSTSVEDEKTNGCGSVGATSCKQIKLDTTIVEENEEEENNRLTGGGGGGDKNRDSTSRSDNSVPSVLNDDTSPSITGDLNTTSPSVTGDINTTEQHVKTKQHKIKKRKRSREEKREHKKHKKHKHKHRHKEKRRRLSSSTENSGRSSVNEENSAVDLNPKELGGENPSAEQNSPVEHIEVDPIKPVLEIVQAVDPLKITVKKADVLCDKKLVESVPSPSLSSNEKTLDDNTDKTSTNDEKRVEPRDVICTKKKEDNLKLNIEHRLGDNRESPREEITNQPKKEHKRKFSNEVKKCDSDKIIEIDRSCLNKYEDKINGHCKIVISNKSLEDVEHYDQNVKEENQTENIHEVKQREINGKEHRKDGKSHTKTDNASTISVQSSDERKPVQLSERGVDETTHEHLILTISTSKMACPKIVRGETRKSISSSYKECRMEDKKEKDTFNGDLKHDVELMEKKNKVRLGDETDNKVKDNSIDENTDETNETLVDKDEKSNGIKTLEEKKKHLKVNKKEVEHVNKGQGEVNSIEKDSIPKESTVDSINKNSSTVDSIPKAASTVPSISKESSTLSSTSKIPKISTTNCSPKVSPKDSSTSISVASSKPPKVSKCSLKEASKPKKSGKTSKSDSSMTHFLPEKQLWDWSGPSYKKCTTKKKGRKIFYKCIERGDESLCVGDSAVFLSTETDQPYIGKIDGFWESYASMNVRVKWFYHPVETVGCPDTLPCIDDALFEACHFDENDIQTISHKCQVLSLDEYKTKLNTTGGDNTDLYYLAGQYDHINRKIHLEPDLETLVNAGGEN